MTVNHEIKSQLAKLLATEDLVVEHKNMIIYLTDPQGGSTIIEDKEYRVKEDDVLFFDGQSKHCARPPSRDVRIVLVFTFL